MGSKRRKKEKSNHKIRALCIVMFGNEIGEYLFNKIVERWGTNYDILIYKIDDVIKGKVDLVDKILEYMFDFDLKSNEMVIVFDMDSMDRWKDTYYYYQFGKYIATHSEFEKSFPTYVNTTTRGLVPLKNFRGDDL